jgi:hypothetical protein
MPASSIFPSPNHSNRDDVPMKFSSAQHYTNPAIASPSVKSIGLALVTSLLALTSMQTPARSEPTGFEPLQLKIIGESDQDAELQAVWGGTLRPRMQTLNARFNTARGDYILSVKKDRCANTGNVTNLFACPARLVLISAGKPVVVQDYAQFYFSGELPTSTTAATYIVQSGRNHTCVALDVEQGALIVQDTNNGSTGTETLTFIKP